MPSATSPFSLDLPGLTGPARWTWRGVAPLLARVTGLASLAERYDALRELPRGAAFFAAALDALDITLSTSDADLERQPAHGGCLIVANHPLGPVDGLLVVAAVARVRSDVKILTNDVVTRIHEIAPACIGVDVYGGRSAVHRNAVALRQAIAWVRAGHALVVFPAGEVSDRDDGTGGIVDAPWVPAVARLAGLCGAPVVPMLVDAQPRRLGVRAGRLHWALRTVMLPRELLRMAHQTVAVRVGRTIGVRDLTAMGGREAQVAGLRLRTYALQGPAPRASSRTGHVAVARECPAGVLEAELAQLPADAVLARSGAWTVYLASAPRWPRMIDEIGRLRELTFREVGEGTGRARDLDRFDRDYLHLVVWNGDDRRVAGAYRLGCSDRVRRRFGRPDLYTRTLFRYGRPMLDGLGASIELGRAFVRREYQREFAPLLMLWKGIGAFVARNPRYRRLFGPVSISAEYPQAVRALMAAALQHHAGDASLAPLVVAHHPVRGDVHGLAPLCREGIAGTVDDLDRLVRAVDPIGRGIPVLLRQYLRLNGRLVSFSLDPAFGNTIDGLIVVDLLAVPVAVLARYMGRDDAAGFRAAHRADGGDVPPGRMGQVLGPPAMAKPTA